jgi:hypothetical protein
MDNKKLAHNRIELEQVQIYDINKIVVESASIHNKKYLVQDTNKQNITNVDTSKKHSSDDVHSKVVNKDTSKQNVMNLKTN